MNKISDIICRPIQDAAELNEAFSIRKKIFVDEQGLFKSTDRDEQDQKAIHLIAWYKDKIIGTVRLYEEEDNVWWGGRLAIIKPYRGKAGKLLVQKALEVVKQSGALHFYANIQIDNVIFFENMSWKSVGNVCLLHGKQHQLMEADLGE